MPPVEVTRTYLAMDQPPAPDRGPSWPPGFHLQREVVDEALYRQLYASVGGAWHWRDRLPWTDEQLRTHLTDPAIAVWVLREDGAPRGFFELARHGDGSVEIAYFGLLPGAMGRGLGRALLIAAIDAAWALDPARVWLHTCTLDHPAALPNYLSRGFRITHTEQYVAELPATA